MDRTGKARLLKLAAYEEGVAPSKFTMPAWDRSSEEECGFAGCSIGWATHAKLFRGLEFSGIIAGMAGRFPTYQGESGFQAVAKLFRITISEAERLFSGGWHMTPKAHAERIRAFVACKSERDA